MLKINTALLSFGMSGKVFHAPFIDFHDGFNFYAVLERSKNRAPEIYPDVKTYKNLDELLSDPQIELVVVNTPNATHFEYAKKALEAGKHVIVEKPFTVTVDEGKQLITLAENNKLLLSVYHNRRYDSDYKTVKKIIDEGCLGKIAEAEFHFDRYKLEPSPKVHKEIPGPGTGALYDLGSHLIDQALQLFGRPHAVFADIRIVRPQSLVDDYFELLFYYPELRVRLHCSYLVRETLPAYILHGTHGSFIKAKTDVQETMLQSGVKPGGTEWGKEPESEKGLLHTEKDGISIREYITSLPGNYGDYYTGIYEAIRENAAVPVSASDALSVIKIIESAFKSVKEQKLIVIEY